ncbi:hypothetical protein J437_LFUL016671 [Ladona fulva]|uniref:Uncharacterized protein n=1 Tax=Ladona fulva TaxID=123851 RepID=A0A8K0KSZ9_LADFU|nr:hypothetical protein J437_LFUL016671 [Ladona fulva]
MRGQNMVHDGHYASSRIDAVSKGLQERVGHVRDIASVRRLRLQDAIESQMARETVAAFKRAQHFMADELKERVDMIAKRYEALREPLQIRRSNLEEALQLQQYLRDVEDEIRWLEEKEGRAASTDLGNSLTAYYAEASEAEAWILERQPLLTSSDLGQDEDSAAALIRRLDAADRELGTFQVSLGKLADAANGLKQRGHFDAENVSKKQSEVESAFMDLKKMTETRRKRLEESLCLFRFLREADDAIEWVNDQTSIAASEDYGQDVEHVEILTAEFEAFATTLGLLTSTPAGISPNVTPSSTNQGLSGGIGGDARINSVLEAGAVLLEEAHPESELIQLKMEETRQVWEDLKELAHARSEALAGAKQVHLFDRTVDETIGWIQEKENELLAEDYGQDMETIQALSRKHQAFESDLEAVREKVVTLVEEAHRLGSLFPDAKEHIDSKKEEAVESWNELEANAAERKDKLGQRERLQAYFYEAWINDMLAKVTAPDLARDVPGAEALVNRHNEYKSEIETRTDAFEKFYSTGNSLILQLFFKFIPFT